MTIAQAQALERLSDPFDEIAYMLGGNRQNNRFWRETLTNLARHVGVAQPIVETQVASASIRTVRRTLGAPFRKLTGRG